MVPPVGAARKPDSALERRAVQDRADTVRQGRSVGAETDDILLTPHGAEGKARIEQPCKEWLEKVKPQVGAVRDGEMEMAESRFPREWLEDVEKGYDYYCRGEELPVDGTPLRSWPLIGPSQLQTCLS